MFRTLSFDDFGGLVGAAFVVCDDGAPPLVLTLAEATPLAAHGRRDGGRAPFSLIFVGSADFLLPQQMYRLRHDELGEVVIFLVPVGRDEQGVSYQALFN
jgi:hypothetical protein